ncbi:outer membrane beta-barrel protein [Ahrensia sp. R2A130]|uniref:outer membrane beta-barrel protein n=1 Tax=Ahrensia sp. R2A130 TaxID=744979 RepID=UPI0001E0C370|nr:outer membrane beta-barrel protein [Ahrensia sp. R2A130]EFL88786.1 conserved hypothetical protein [Ahrensia sp. R2A130]
MTNHIRHLFCGTALVAGLWTVSAFAQSAGTLDNTVLRGNIDGAATTGQLATEDAFAEPLFDPNAEQQLNASRASVEPLQNADTAEVPTTGRAQPAGRVGTLQADGSVTPLANTRVDPIEANRSTAGADPYAPLGIRRGSFTLFPVLTQSFGYTTNANDTPEADAAGFSRSQADLTAISDWSRHQLTIRGTGSYQTFFDTEADDTPTLEGDVELRLDHSRALTATYGVSANWTTESISSNNLSGVAVSEEPGLLQYGARGQLDYQPGALGVTLRGSVDRLEAEDVALSGGGTLDQSDRDFILALAAIRTTWTESAVLQPYAEVEIGRRAFDKEVDSNGERRTADILALRAGVAFDGGEKWTGSAELGYRIERLDDPRLENLEGFTFDGTLNWSPRRFTQVSANLQTQANTSTVAGESGSLTYAGTLGVTQDLRENLSINAQAGLAFQDFTGSQADETTLQVAAGTEWRLNRNAAIFGTVDYEFTNDGTGRRQSTTTRTALIGLRVQR